MACHMEASTPKESKGHLDASLLFHGEGES